MSIVWVVLLAGSLAAAAVNGRMNALTASISTSAQSAVTLSLGLVGVMTLWLGLMRVAEEAGIVALLARAARPLLRRLFPEVPEGHPAMGAMVMNVAANLLGLGNAATPFGLEAMRRLDELNPHRGTASDAQALFCALNTASLQIIPATVIALRTGAGARNPADVIGPVIVASTCAALVAVVAAKLLAGWYPLPRQPDVPPRPGQGDPAGMANTVPGDGRERSGDRAVPRAVPGERL